MADGAVTPGSGDPAPENFSESIGMDNVFAMLAAAVLLLVVENVMLAVMCFRLGAAMREVQRLRSAGRE